MPEDIQQDTCELCRDNQAQTYNTPGYDGIYQSCPRCGDFKITGTALSMLSQGIGKEKRAKLSSWSLDQNRGGALPVIASNTIDKITSRPLPTVTDRAIRLLKEASYGQTKLGDNVKIGDPRFIAATYSQDSSEVSFLLKLLSEQGFMKPVVYGGECEILLPGYVELDKLANNVSDSKQCFVAMWFDSSMNSAYTDGFQQGIMNAGFDPLRIDKHEHINRIDDEIIAQIKVSRFVVADFTGHRAGVYFEAGFALGIGLPVIWTCRKDSMSDLHFDIRQFNCIDWEAQDDLAVRLENRVKAILGDGALS